MYQGWYQVAFEREVDKPFSPISIAKLDLLIVQRADAVDIFSARCPHRGAHLGYGGRLEGDAVICPFHGRRIGLSAPGDDGFCLRHYHTLNVGGLLFTLLDGAHDHGLAAFLADLDETHYFVPGFTLAVRTAPELVIENALDGHHFAEVHGIPSVPVLNRLQSRNGELAVRARLSTPRLNRWQDEAASEVDLRLRIFSPNLCVTQLGDGAASSYVLTAATPDADGMCQIRISLIVPPAADGGAPDQEPVRALLRDSRTALEQDAKIWQHLPVQAKPVRGDRVTPGDELVAAYYAFCDDFLPQPAP